MRFSLSAFAGHLSAGLLLDVEVVEADGHLSPLHRDLDLELLRSSTIERLRAVWGEAVSSMNSPSSFSLPDAGSRQVSGNQNCPCDIQNSFQLAIPCEMPLARLGAPAFSCSGGHNGIKRGLGGLRIGF